MQIPFSGSELLLFQASPSKWYGDFKLHAPMNTSIEARTKDGRVVKLEVHPESRRKDVIVLLNQ